MWRMPLLIFCSRLFVKILSIRIAIEEVMRVGLEIRGYILLDNIRLMNPFIHVQYSDVMRFLVRHNRHHKVSQSVPLFKSHKTVTIFLRIKVGPDTL